VKNETSLGIEQKTEDISGLLELKDVHESSGEVVVSTDFSVNLYTTLKTDLHALLVGEGILKSITENDGEGKALTHLVRTGRRLGSPNSSHLGKAPMLGGIDTLEVLLESVWPVN